MGVIMKPCNIKRCDQPAVIKGRGKILGLCPTHTAKHYRDYNKRNYSSTKNDLRRTPKMPDKRSRVNRAMLTQCRNPEKFCKLVERRIREIYS